MRTQKNFVRFSSQLRAGIFWLLDWLAVFFERLAELTTDKVLRLRISNAIILCVYEDLSRDIDIWVGETSSYITRSQWNKFANDFEGIAEWDGYVLFDRSGKRISVTRLENDVIELRFHAMLDGGVVRVRRSDLIVGLVKYRAYVEAAGKH
jgi:hypothetical protein